MANENFILPKTESSVNRIINSVSKFFEITGLCFSGFYAAYTIFRIFLMKNLLVLNLLFAGFTVVLTGLFFFEFFSKKAINKKAKLVISVMRRLVCCVITVVVFCELFNGAESLHPYNIFFALFFSIGLVMTIIGDVFNATVPKWANEILASFKEDIDISGLATRSFGQLKEAVAKNDNIKEGDVKVALFAGGTMALGALRKLVHKKK